MPATIAVEDGEILRGVADSDIERFATGSDIPKVSSRDLPVVLAQGRRGALTVASSVVAAELAGIPFFASAGIGGVHRGAETSMDISSDLVQFTRSKVAVVCAGAKKDPGPRPDAGVPGDPLRAGGLLPLRRLPGLLLHSGGFRKPYRVDEDEVIARAIENHWALGGQGSFLICRTTSSPAAATRCSPSA
ncbi:Pseudouridine-5'-phosphate glycosidase OS=Streptomyces microflavus OX=1919 GN=psuG_2 PE=3 SV=1 [Streptomyces microflavus]